MARLNRRVSGAAYRRITFVALVALYAIVVTGALVRLTGSGLGCSDWPRCSESRFIDVSTGHGAIEQINRLFTGVVAFSVVLAVLASLRLEARRRSLTWLSLGLVGGVLAQVVIGGVVVLTGLNPWANMAHFLVSMLLLANALILHRSASSGGTSESSPKTAVPSGVSRESVNAAAVVVFGMCALVTGTVVTATGPHAGDEDAVRFGFAISSVARVHSITVIATLSAVVLLLVRSRRMGGSGAGALEEKTRALLGLGLLQAFIGYVQYFADVPALLVAFHVALAAGVWLALVDLAIVAVSWAKRDV